MGRCRDSFSYTYPRRPESDVTGRNLDIIQYIENKSLKLHNILNSDEHWMPQNFIAMIQFSRELSLYMTRSTRQLSCTLWWVVAFSTNNTIIQPNMLLCWTQQLFTWLIILVVEVPSLRDLYHIKQWATALTLSFHSNWIALRMSSVPSRFHCPCMPCDSCDVISKGFLESYPNIL